MAAPLEALVKRFGRREWRRLCSDESLVARFPDKHFDLDTAAELHTPFSVEAEMRAAQEAEAGVYTIEQQARGDEEEKADSDLDDDFAMDEEEERIMREMAAARMEQERSMVSETRRRTATGHVRAYS